MPEDFSLQRKIGEIRTSNDNYSNKIDKSGFEVEDTSIFSGINHYDDFIKPQIFPDIPRVFPEFTTLDDKKEKYKEHVNSQDVMDALFYLEGSSGSYNDKKKIDEQIQKAIQNAKTFNDVNVQERTLSNFYVLDDNVNPLPNKLDNEQKKQYLESDKGKEALNEIGIEQKSASLDGKNYVVPYYEYKGQRVDVDVSSDGTLRVSYTDTKISNQFQDGMFCNHHSYETVEHIADFKLNDTHKPNSSIENTSGKLYNDEPNFKKHESGNFEKKPEDVSQMLAVLPGIDISNDNLQEKLTGENAANTELADKLKKASGKELSDLKFEGNYAYFKEGSEVADESRILNTKEQRFYYDKKSGEFVKVDINREENHMSNLSPWDQDTEIYLPQKNEPENSQSGNTIHKYTVDDKFIDLENHLREKGIETEIYADTIQTLIRHKEYEKTGEIVLNEDFGKTEIGQKLEQITGKKIEDLTFFGNQVHYTDEKGVEHQYYYDNKSGEFINANVVKNDQGSYDVEVKSTKNADTSNTPDEKQKLEGLIQELLSEIQKLIDMYKDSIITPISINYKEGWDSNSMMQSNAQGTDNLTNNPADKIDEAMQKLKEKHQDIPDELWQQIKGEAQNRMSQA